MHFQWSEYFKILSGLIAIVNPIGIIPIFAGLTANQTDSERLRTTRVSSITVFIVMAVVLFVGNQFLELFGINIDSFSVGGGLLILMMAISMLHGKQSRVKQTREEEEEAVSRDSIAVVPLAIPLLAGPGAISTVILYSNRQSGFANDFIVLTAIAATTVVIYFSLRFAPKIAKLIGKTGVNIITRIMGLIIAAMGVEFIAKGLLALLPGLNR